MSSMPPWAKWDPIWSAGVRERNIITDNSRLIKSWSEKYGHGSQFAVWNPCPFLNFCNKVWCSSGWSWTYNVSENLDFLIFLLLPPKCGNAGVCPIHSLDPWLSPPVSFPGKPLGDSSGSVMKLLTASGSPTAWYLLCVLSPSWFSYVDALWVRVTWTPKELSAEVIASNCLSVHFDSTSQSAVNVKFKWFHSSMFSLIFLMHWPGTMTVQWNGATWKTYVSQAVWSTLLSMGAAGLGCFLSRNRKIRCVLMCLLRIM